MARDGGPRPAGRVPGTVVTVTASGTVRGFQVGFVQWVLVCHWHCTVVGFVGLGYYGWGSSLGWPAAGSSLGDGEMVPDQLLQVPQVTLNFKW